MNYYLAFWVRQRYVLALFYAQHPVRSTEGDRSNGEIMGRLMHCLVTRDFNGSVVVKELTDCTWEMARYTHHSDAQPQ
jgi:hypothetical protein